MIDKNPKESRTKYIITKFLTNSHTHIHKTHTHTKCSSFLRFTGELLNAFEQSKRKKKTNLNYYKKKPKKT